MSHEVAETAQRFGGDWRQEKLEILRAYLETYTTALKKRGFKLCYVDAFAGSGSIEAHEDQDGRQLLEGSPTMALEVRDRPFDRLVFVEKDAVAAQSLRQLIAQREESHRCEIIVDDANSYLPTFCAQMGSYDRAVVFLDPFGAQVDWSTVQIIADTEKCDTWILFPVSTIRRLLPRRGDVRTVGNETRLMRVFGDESWRDLQHLPAQRSLFGDDQVETDPGVAGIVETYRGKLNQAFAQVAPNARTFRNSRNSPMYELMFAAGNPRGAPLAVKIADYILTRL